MGAVLSSTAKINEKDYEEELLKAAIHMDFVRKLYEIKSEESEIATSEFRFQAFLKIIYHRLCAVREVQVSQLNLGTRALDYFLDWLGGWPGVVGVDASYLASGGVGRNLVKLLSQNERVMKIRAGNCGLNPE
ncbi:unnamed protein product [Sphagnum balticum]